jgi:hypothetical protein
LDYDSRDLPRYPRVSTTPTSNGTPAPPQPHPAKINLIFPQLLSCTQSCITRHSTPHYDRAQEACRKRESVQATSLKWSSSVKSNGAHPVFSVSRSRCIKDYSIPYPSQTYDQPIEGDGRQPMQFSRCNRNVQTAGSCRFSDV